MKSFRRLYYKLSTLFCIVATFVYLLNMDKGGVGYAILYMFAGFLCFGSLSIGKEDIDPEKPIRNILLFLAWSLLAFGITSMGIAALIEKSKDQGLLTAFLVLAAMGLMVVYVLTIILTLDWFAIISVALLVGGMVLGAHSNGVVILGILTILILLGSAATFVLSLIYGPADDD